MKYNVKKEFYYNYFISNGYKYISSGYMHNIFEKDNRIIKVAKEEFIKFNSKDNYLLEKKCLNILKNNGYVTPKVYKVSNFNIEGKKLNYLEEEKIPGEVKTYSEMNEKEKEIIFKLYNDVSKIKGKKYGAITLEKDGDYDTWYDYLKELFRRSKYIIKKFNLDINFKEIEESILSKIDKDIEPSFLILDPNENNFFLINNKVSCIIDIDHPVYGDRLYQFALFKYFRKNYYSYLIKKGFITKHESEIIDLYTIVFSLSDIYFKLGAEENNEKDMPKHLLKVMNNYKKFKGGKK